MARSFGSLGLSLGLLCGAPACDTRQETPPATAPLPHAPREAPSLEEKKAALLPKLSSSALYHERFSTKILYTWTTRAQIEEIRSTRILLSRTVSVDGKLSLFDASLEEEAQSLDPGGDMFKALWLLRSEVFNKRRFAWVTPWPTLLGWEGETYGQELLRVVLKDDAILGRFEPAAPALLRFYDLEGREVALKKILADPEKLAAVYHISPNTPEHLGYREFVLCNESMIKEWSYSTPEIRDELEGSIELVALLDDYFKEAPAPEEAERELNQRALQAVWPAPVESPKVSTLYEASLAFPNSRYQPTPKNLDALKAALTKALPQGEPLRHTPTVAFPSVVPVTKTGMAPHIKPAHRIPKSKYRSKKCFGTLCP